MCGYLSDRPSDLFASGIIDQTASSEYSLSMEQPDKEVFGRLLLRDLGNDRRLTKWLVGSRQGKADDRLK
jgi:hypothetical protein